jgi:hypothetical protein
LGSRLSDQLKETYTTIDHVLSRFLDRSDHSKRPRSLFDGLHVHLGIL